MDDRLREMVEDDFCDRHAFEERMEMPIEAETFACRDRKVAKLVRDAHFKPPLHLLRGRRVPEGAKARPQPRRPPLGVRAGRGLRGRRHDLEDGVQQELPRVDAR